MVFPRLIFPSLQQALVTERVIVLTGMRRVGKTTTIRWLLEQIPTANKIYLDLERLDYRQVFQDPNYEAVLGFLRSLNLDVDQPAWVALDEIQYVPNLPSVVKYLYDTDHIKFLLTGSSSFYLKNLFTESLAGRKLLFELFPLTFGEFLDFRQVPYRKINSPLEAVYDPHEYARLQPYYEEYLQFGGMPDAVLTAGAADKQAVLQEIYSSYINIDVRTLADFNRLPELQQLLRILASRIGSKVDHTKLSTITGLSRPTVLAYLEFLERTYMIVRLPAFSASQDRVAAQGKKLYFYDTGIANTLSRLSEGAAYENTLFNQLRPFGKLSYLSKGSQVEIDFILENPAGEAIAMEAKTHPTPDEERRLIRLAERLGLGRAYLVGRYPTPDYTRFLWAGSIH